jgi:hypothetical protein
VAEQDKDTPARSRKAPDVVDPLEAQEAAIRERDRGADAYMDNAVDVRNPGPEAVKRAEQRAAGGKVQEPIERSTTMEALHDVHDPDATPHWVQRVPVAPGREPV